MWEETIGGMQNKTRQNRTKLQHKLQIRSRGNDQPGDLGEPPENASSQTSLFYLKSRFCPGLIGFWFFFYPIHLYFLAGFISPSLQSFQVDVFSVLIWVIVWGAGRRSGLPKQWLVLVLETSNSHRMSEELPAVGAGETLSWELPGGRGLRTGKEVGDWIRYMHKYLTEVPRWGGLSQACGRGRNRLEFEEESKYFGIFREGRPNSRTGSSSVTKIATARVF